MSKLKITLKQHTPLIHFQPEQDGAIIRSTEFKPKLDKFLIEHAFEGTIEEKFEQYKKYLIGYKEGKTKEDFKDKEAFNYKVRFLNASDRKVQDIKGKKPFYFNNIEKNNTDRNKFVFCSSVDVEFFTLNTGILDIINKWIEKFLLLTNFGFRQNKGFGSFYLDEYKDILKLFKEVYKEKKIFYIKYKENVTSEEIMNDAAIIYQVMKSGINFPHKYNNGKMGSYHKGYLFQYMLKKNIGNEKRFIKENFFLINQRIKTDGMDKRYIRAMLGVSDGIEFRDERWGRIKYSSDIERFKSPILFKVIDKILFIIPQNIPKEMYNRRFIFSQNNNSKKIYTPKEEHFYLDDFLASFVDYFNNQLEVEKTYNPLENKLRSAKNKKIEVVK